MRRRRALLGLLLACSFGFAAPAAAAPCSADTQAAAPSGVPSDGGSLDTGTDFSWQIPAGLHVTIAAAGPTPISHPSDGISTGAVPFRFEEGDGPAQITAYGPYPDFIGSYCDLAPVSRVVNPRPPAEPEPEPTGPATLYDAGIDQSNKHVDRVEWDFEVTSGDPGRVVVKVWRNHVTGAIKSDPMAPFTWERRRVKRRGFTLSATRDSGGLASVYFRPSLRRQFWGWRRYHYSVTRDGRRLKRGTFTVGIRHHRRAGASVTRIWEGTDDFVNLCINGSFTIYSEGGQLYCELDDYRPGHRAFTSAEIYGGLGLGVHQG